MDNLFLQPAFFVKPDFFGFNLLLFLTVKNFSLFN